MKQALIAFVVILSSLPSYSQEIYKVNINKVCANLVGIPYASDNFSDEEWEQFKTCLNYMRHFQE